MGMIDVEDMLKDLNMPKCIEIISSFMETVSENNLSSVEFTIIHTMMKDIFYMFAEHDED